MQQEVIEGFQISPQQNNLWKLQQEDNQYFRAQYILLIEGHLNFEKLENTLSQIIEKHEILRTNFRYLPGMTIPVQVINNSDIVSIQYYEWSSLDTSTQNTNIESLFNQNLEHPINLEIDSPLRLSLVTLSVSKYLLLISLPAMNADSATLKNLVGEIRSIYAASDSENLSVQSLQYADISEWQNEIIESEDAIAREYNQKLNFSCLNTRKLAFEQQTTTCNTFKPSFLQFKLSENLLTNFQVILDKYQTRSEVVLLTAWLVLLRRIYRKTEIVTGCIFDGRKYDELKDSLGLLAKNIPISCNLENIPFHEALKIIQNNFNDCYNIQEYYNFDVSENIKYLPFIFDWIELTHSSGVDEVKFSVIQQYVCFDKFNLKLTCLHQDDSLFLEMHYNENLFDREDIKYLAGIFQTLLENIIRNPETKIDCLNILTETEQNRLLLKFNQTATNNLTNKCIHLHFAEQAELKPNHIAVIFEEQQLTYKQLNQSANQLAHYLQELGVKPEVIVGIYLERTPQFIVAVLAILKAGGAYLPLETSLPNEALAFRLQDAGVSLLISNSKLNINQQQAQVIYIDNDWETITTKSQENPLTEVKIDNLAYLLYTSGSTGKPKGVAVEHQQIVNYFYAIVKRLNLTTCNSFASVSTFAADLGNTTIFPSLCLGKCLHIISSDRATNPDALADYFHDRPIDCLKIVPSHLKALLTSSNAEYILPQKRLILGGEACSWNLIAQIKNYSPKCQIINHYGPTETTVGALTYSIQLTEQTENNCETVPIGRPLNNIQTYILDSYFKPVPVGVPGEIYIGGMGVARGYFNQAELTKQKFICNLPILSGKRLYKTGDLARYLPNGNIEFLARIDNQVKIHGYRIELGEIEATLSQHSAVQETVVVLKEDKLGNQRLIAYFVSRQKTVSVAKTLVDELRNFLQQQLPEYMIPVLVELMSLPLTPNGKIDRKLLPTPDFSKPDTQSSFTAPRTPIEQTLALLWSEILGIGKVGIYDNFFELGGDSILSMQLIAKARQKGIKIAPKQIFDYQTVAELAAVASTALTSPSEQGLVIGTLPLTPIQHWFFAQNLPDLHHWNQSILLECVASIDANLFPQIISKLLEHHDALRLQFKHQKDTWQQLNATFEQEIPFTHIDLSKLAPEAQKLAIVSTTNQLQTSLNLSSKLIQVAFFNLGADKPGRLLIIIHHLAVDGVSWRILLEDLQTAYQLAAKGETIHLPPKSTSYKQWAQRLYEYAQNGNFEQESTYWFAESRKQIRPLAIDKIGGENTIAQAKTVSITLNCEETKALLTQVPAAYHTQINHVLLAALLQAFQQWTGESQLLIDLEAHGREDIFPNIDLSRTVGWFTTIFPVLLHQPETNDTVANLDAVKQQLQEIPNHGINYGVLRYLGDEEIKQQLQNMPPAEVRFNYLGQSDQIFQKSSLFVPALESSGISRSLKGNRSYLLDINGIITQGKLQLDWTYSQAIHHQETIENLATNFAIALHELISHSQSLQLNTSTSKPTSNIQDFAALSADAILDSTITPDSLIFENTTTPANILLTGSTGFLGAFLLTELLQQTQANIYCLVRSENADFAKQRILNNLDTYLIAGESLNERIIPLVGDLSQPLLGLSYNQFQEMAHKIDIIYHNGAITNLVYPYSSLRATNVLGTQEILKLATQIKIKPIHYISTLNVLYSIDKSQTNVIPELDNLKQVVPPQGGYAQTKWVAEQLAMTARDRGLPVNIYRLGRVAGHSQTGVCNPNDRLYRMLKGFIQLGVAPQINVAIDMTPVDYVSKAIIYLSGQKEFVSQVFHICNPHPINVGELLKIIKSYGYSIDSVPFAQWQTELTKDSQKFAENALYPLMPFLTSGEFNIQNTMYLEQTLNSSNLKFDCKNTITALSKASIICPSIDAQLVKTYFDYLNYSGFLGNVPIR